MDQGRFANTAILLDCWTLVRDSIGYRNDDQAIARFGGCITVRLPFACAQWMKGLHNMALAFKILHRCMWVLDFICPYL